MPDHLYEFEIFCDGPGCETASRHVLWADSPRAALTRARQELVRYHRWARVMMHSKGQPPHAVDLCPNCKSRLTRHPKKELLHA